MILTDSTPIVVLEYENLNLASDNLTAQAICVSAEPKESSTLALALPTAPQKPPDNDQIASANSEPAAAAQQPPAEPPPPPAPQQQQPMPATVNIIRCITSAEEVPTIHIVDTLENEAVVKKIKGAFHSLNSADIKSIEDLVNKSGATGSAASKEERISLSFLNAATILQPKEAGKAVEDSTAGNDHGRREPARFYD